MKTFELMIFSYCTATAAVFLFKYINSGKTRDIIAMLIATLGVIVSGIAYSYF